MTGTKPVSEISQSDSRFQKDLSLEELLLPRVKSI